MLFVTKIQKFENWIRVACWFLMIFFFSILSSQTLLGNLASAEPIANINEAQIREAQNNWEPCSRSENGLETSVGTDNIAIVNDLCSEDNIEELVSICTEENLINNDDLFNLAEEKYQTTGNLAGTTVDISYVGLCSFALVFEEDGSLSEENLDEAGIGAGAVDPETIEENVQLTDGDAVEENQSCESEGGALAYISCLLLMGLDETISGIDGAINSLLLIDYERLTENGGLESAWSRFRNIAYILLIPIMLIMVISTALGFNFVDAYTVKRAMPRMLVAVIFIALSWDITRIMIEITNEVGLSIAGLIGTAVSEEGLAGLQLTDVFSVSESATASGVTVAGFGIAAGVVAIAIASGALGAVIGYLLLLLFAAFLALTAAFFLLALRQIIIVALVIVAPLAILSWIFPGNDKLWKLWWGSFSKLLLLFPVIILLTTTGKAFAYIMFDSGGSADAGVLSAIIDFTLKIVAYIGPYFFIPAMFKYAGGVFSNLAGMVNNKEKGLFDRAKKARGGLAKKGYEQGKYGVQTGKIGGRMGRGLQKASHANKLGWSDIRKGKKGIGSALTQASRLSEKVAGEELAKDKALEQVLVDDAVSGNLAALMNGDKLGLARRLQKKGLSEGKAMQEADAFIKRAESGDLEGSLKQILTTYEKKDEGEGNIASAQISAARRKHGDGLLKRQAVQWAVKGGTYYEDGAHMLRAVELATTNKDSRGYPVVDGNAKGELTNAVKGAALSAGRADLVAGFGDSLKAATEAGNVESLGDLRKKGKDFTKRAWNSKSMITKMHESMKSDTTDNFIEHLKSEVETAYTSGDRQQVVSKTAEISALMQYGETYFKPDIVNKLKTGLQGMQVPFEGEQTTLADATKRLREDPEFSKHEQGAIEGEQARQAAERALGASPGGAPAAPWST